MIVTFTDADGTEWEAWEAHPTLRERRSQERRAAARDVPDRRVRATPGFSRGWLVFRSGTDRRRLRDIPEGWATLGQDGLRALLEQAVRPSGALRWAD